MKTEDVKLFTFIIFPRKRACHIVTGNEINAYTSRAKY